MSAYHLNSFMLLLTKLTHMVTLVKKSLLKLLTNFTIFLTYLYGFSVLFMTVLKANQTNTFLLNLIISLLHYLLFKRNSLQLQNLYGH